MARLNMNVPDELLKKVDSRAKAMNVNRSAYINMALTRQVETEEMTSNFPMLLDIMNKAVDESKASRALKIQSP